MEKLQAILGLLLLTQALVQAATAQAATAQETGDGSNRVVLFSFISDTVLGQDVSDVNCTLFKLDPYSEDDGSPQQQWRELARAATSLQGQVRLVLGSDSRVGSVYKLVMETEPYYVAQNLCSFYSYVEVVFERLDEENFILIPVLISPFSYLVMLGHASESTRQRFA